MVTQLLIELFFTGGAIGIAYKNQILPKLPKKATGQIAGIICIAIIAGYLIKQYALQGLSILHFLIFAFLLNAFLLLASLKTIKNVAKGLTTD